MLAPDDREAQLANEIHRVLLFNWVVPLQLGLQIVHVLIKEDSWLIGLRLLLLFGA